ncbi:MAG: hypothetical protein AB7J40_00820 [Candidatus Altimarinota bacterium]
MKKNKAQNPFAYGTNDDPLRIGKLIDAIQDSALSAAKKLAYLYLIAEGSFTGATMKMLRKDMEDQEKIMVRQLRAKEKALQQVDQEIESLEQSILELTPKAMDETQENLQQLVEMAAHETQKNHKNKS